MNGIRDGTLISINLIASRPFMLHCTLAACEPAACGSERSFDDCELAARAPFRQRSFPLAQRERIGTLLAAATVTIH